MGVEMSKGEREALDRNDGLLPRTECENGGDGLNRSGLDGAAEGFEHGEV